MASALDNIKAVVTAQTTVMQSAETLLEQLKAQLDAAIASGDPAQIQALADQIGANTTALAAAITANTPAAPAPAPSPAPAPVTPPPDPVATPAAT